MNTWNGILTIIDIQHKNSKDEILWEQKNVNNLLHQEGENFLLGIAFAGFAIPSNYYLGLDNRAIVAASDTLDELIGIDKFNLTYSQRNSVLSIANFYGCDAAIEEAKKIEIKNEKLR